MVGRRVIVAKPWNPSPVASTVESCSSTSSGEASEDASSFFTTTGTPTIDTALREGDMPEVRCLTLPDWTTDSSDYDSSESEEVRESAGREVDPRDRDSIVVTISDRDRERDRRTGSEGSDRSNSGAGCVGEELCCLHGRPCAMARTRPENTKQREVKVPGYEPVKIDRLENPPDSFTRRRSERHKASEGQTTASSASIPPKSGQVVYRCRMPSDMSSLASPALSTMSQQSTAAPSDGIYENIDCFNQINNFPITAPSQASVQTARDTTVISHPPDPRRRQPSPTLSDFYLGAMRKRDAEKRVKRRTYFRLYHRVPSNAYSDLTNIRDHVSLYIVYKTSKGGYCHYPIQRVRGETPAGYKSTKYFYVDCMEELPPRFNSLDALVRFYSVYVQLDLVEKAGDVEVFPVPKRDDEREKRHRQKDRRY
uniref:SH2 domain-containing protein n=1 Tax=Panagrellus redivivus TaxID=6233 RepID=A0A7E4US03_PANRE